jgi:hypothetical protein
MATVPEKRKRIEDTIYKTLLLMDPTGINANKYRKMFQTMNDLKFSQWIEAFLNDEKSIFRLDIEEFGDGSRTLKFENVEKAADFLKIKLFEYVYLPHVSSNPNRPIRTKQPVLVGWLNIKRTQQLASKKTGLALSDDNRDDMTGAAKGESKGGTTTGIENEVLAGVGGDIILSEISGARGDNVKEYDNMLSAIAENGSVKLSDIKTNAYDKPTLLAADMYFMAMGIKTDLISESYYSVEKVKRIVDGT